MRGNRSRDTAPEVAVRSALHRLGLRFRKDLHIRIGGPRGVRTDIAFPRQYVAVFVDGCYWHSCPLHGHIPRSNTDYWQAKLKRNAERDVRNNEALRDAGWTVVRVWEHESVEGAVEAVLWALGRAQD
jgi:DNA mismatch endonuclease, patch repair protein